MKNNTLIKLPIYIFAGLIVLNSLLFSTKVIDPTLVIRVSFLACITFGYSIYFLYHSKNRAYNFDLISIVFSVFVLYSITSLIWTFNFSLGIVAVSKTTLFLFLFILSSLLLDEYGDRFLSIFIKFIIGLFILSIISFIINAVDLPSLSRESMYTIFTISGHKNLYSSLLFLISIYSLLGFFYLGKKWKIVLLVSLILQLILVFLLQARAVYMAYFAFLVSALILYLLQKVLAKVSLKKAAYLTLFVFVAFNVFFIYLFPSFIQWYISKLPEMAQAESAIGLSTLTERILVWDKTYEIINQNWWLGVGGGNWAIFYPSFSLPDIYKATDLHTIFQRPHNDFLWMWAEYGIIGLNSFYLFISLILTLTYKSFIRTNNTKYLVLISGIIGFSVISFFSFPRERVEHNLLFFILLSISIYYLKKNIPYITKYSIPVKAKYLWIVTIISIGIFYVSFLVVQGESITKKIHLAKQNANHKLVVELCKNAKSISYQLDPTSMPISWYQGNANIKLGNNEQALISFRESFEQHPYNQYVLNDFASAYYLRNQLDSAKLYFKESARINPRFDDPKLNLTAIFINENNFEKAAFWNNSLLHDSERRTYYIQVIQSQTNTP